MAQVVLEGIVYSLATRWNLHIYLVYPQACKGVYVHVIYLLNGLECQNFFQFMLTNHKLYTLCIAVLDLLKVVTEHMLRSNSDGCICVTPIGNSTIGILDGNYRTTSTLGIQGWCLGIHRADICMADRRTRLYGALHILKGI